MDPPNELKCDPIFYTIQIQISTLFSHLSFTAARNIYYKNFYRLTAINIFSYLFRA